MTGKGMKRTGPGAAAPLRIALSPIPLPNIPLNPEKARKRCQARKSSEKEPGKGVSPEKCRKRCQEPFLDRKGRFG